MAIAWAGRDGALPIIGPRSLEQLISNLGALDLELSEAHLARLAAASDRADDDASVADAASRSTDGRLVA